MQNATICWKTELNPHQKIRPQDHYLGTLDFIVI